MVRLRGVVVVVVLVLVLVVEGVSVNQKTPPPYSSQADDAMKQLMKAGVYLPHIYLPWLVAPNSTCSQALEDMADNIDAKNSWAARMVDSWGKSYDGYYFGSGGLYGVYDECVSTTSTKGDFKGRFCSINMWKIIPEGEEGERSQCTPGQTVPKLTLNLPQQHKLKGLKNMDARNAPAITINYNANIEIFYTTCIPSVCTSDDLGVSLFFTMLSHGYYAYPEACYVEEPEVSYDAAVISFILVFTLLVVASLLDFYILYSGRTQLTKGHLKYLLVFSAYTNAGKIFKINNESPPSTISCLHGMRKSSEYYDKVYFESWCRATPWMIGIWLGYIIVQQGNTRPKMNGLVVAVGWTLATLTGLLVVFGMWSYNIPYITDPSLYITWDTMTQLTYGGLHRPAWAAALAWVVYSCHYGYGGLVNGFLSHPSWQPLSRLTYCMYLVALQMQYLIAYTLRVPFYYTNLNKVIETVGAICVSFPVTVLASLMSEAPIIGLEKLLLGSARKPRPTEAQPTKPTTSDINNPNEAAGDLTEATNTNHHDTPAAGDLTEATNTSNHDTPAAGDLTEATNTSNHDTPAAGDLTEAEKSPLSYMMEDLESNQQQPANNGHDNPTLILEEGLIQRQMNETNNIHL
ncbi:hypothetical protein Pcinc_024604 [Petrolisthes cinctipes]|uniref:Nose resistant-to-fluoxetine protein N-terminal domain-containing protein n=1 Tax=Petrolisthes cinctipes TaxID=88211 RepID=A0AAE1FAA6_PETCI|nr:hypothetical protein Pcinc_024604 [Petrolisthes cinctipes]